MISPAKHQKSLLALAFLMAPFSAFACSIVYYFDAAQQTAFVGNNEDYWHEQTVTLKLIPRSKGKHARLWYGWDDFAQGGVNEHGLFFDGAVTPESEIPAKYERPKGNLGDRILANCSTVQDVLDLLETEKVGLTNAHLLIGDREGNAAIVEWTGEGRALHRPTDNYLIATNYLLSSPEKGNHPCHRYSSIEERIKTLKMSDAPKNLLEVGNTLGGAAQIPRKTDSGKTAGTLYSSFIDLSSLKFVIVPKLDHSRIVSFDLKSEFEKGKRRTIRLK